MLEETERRAHAHAPSLSFLLKQLPIILFFSSSNFSALDIGLSGEPNAPLRPSARRGSLRGGVSPARGIRGRSRPFMTIAFS